MKTTLAITGFALAITLLSFTVHAVAQPYPNKSIRLVVPFPPGGSNDIVGRVVAAGLSDRLGKQVIIDNRAGGNSIN